MGVIGNSRPYLRSLQSTLASIVLCTAALFVGRQRVSLEIPITPVIFRFSLSHGIKSSSSRGCKLALFLASVMFLCPSSSFLR